jgi:hypothetical protein
MRYLARTTPVLLVLLVAGRVGLAEEEDPQLAAAVAAIRAADTYDDEAVGYAGAKTDTYKAFEVLRARAGVELLRRLTDDEDPILRCYALRALVTAHPEEPIGPVVLEHLTDTEDVETFSGCIRATDKAGDVMLDMSWPRLSGPWKQRILAKLVEPDCPLAGRGTALRSRTFGPDLRARIRALAMAGDEDALVALARYRDPEDLPLIEAPLGAESAPYVARLRALTAAKLHAHPALLPVLAALEGEARIALEGRSPHHARFWFEAVAAQRSPKAAALLLRILEPGVPRRSAEILSKALEDEICDANLPVLWRLFEGHGLVSPKVFEFLAAADPERAAGASESRLAGSVSRMPRECFAAMFALLEERRPERVVPLLADALDSSDVHHFPALARLAGAKKDEAFVAPLFSRVAGETNPHFYLAAAEAILAYGRPDLRERLSRLVDLHEHLRTGWGGKKLADLLGQ